MSEKAVLISIRPKWCELIASGKKTLEVRKNRPKQEPPFTCYIYETQPVGRVIGEFTCTKIFKLKRGLSFTESGVCFALRGSGRITDPAELWKYSDGADLYGWHIASLIIYDEPLELSDFGLPPLKKAMLQWWRDLKRAPQSWCYVLRKRV